MPIGNYGGVASYVVLNFHLALQNLKYGSVGFELFNSKNNLRIVFIDYTMVQVFILSYFIVLV